MTSQVCVDSSTLLTYVLQEPRWQVVESVLDRADRVVLPAPGLAEVIAVARRKGNRATGTELMQALAARGVHYEPAGVDDLVEAADLWEMSRAHPGPADGQGRPALLSMADAVILAVARRLGGPVVSRDRYWTLLHDKGLLTVDVVGF